MEKLGLMTDAGRAVLPDMSPTGFIIDGDILTALKADEAVWNNFMNFPPLYRSRLEKFIERTRLNIMYGEWNDNGRLLNY